MKGGHAMRKLMSHEAREKAKRKAQVVSGIVVGIIGLVFLLILGYVFIDTLTSSSLVTNAASAAAIGNVTGNFTTGVYNVAGKIPTLFTVGAIVLIVGALMFLWGYYQRMKLGSNNSSL
jgi:multisubunit Na+/H+ antiporter MnhB subunit